MEIFHKKCEKAEFFGVFIVELTDCICSGHMQSCVLCGNSVYGPILSQSCATVTISSVQQQQDVSQIPGLLNTNREKKRRSDNCTLEPVIHQCPQIIRHRHGVAHQCARSQPSHVPATIPGVKEMSQEECGGTCRSICVTGTTGPSSSPP